MRFLHTSDWHLGRLFYGVHLTDDQAHVLDQLVDLARRAKVEAVVVAGDLYDRAVPPPEAVRLLDDVLTRLALAVGVPVLAIAGNHDSPERVGFGARLLAARGVHLAGRLPPSTVELRDRHGPVAFHLVSYAEPAVAREALEEPQIADHAASFAAIVRRIPRAPRSVLVAHAFVAGGLESPDSERPLSVGGTGTVPPGTFDRFSYVALGHLHRPQAVGRETLRYSGSLLKYGFGEAAHGKSVSVVEMDRSGGCRVEEVPLSPRRDVRRLRGTLAQVLEGAEGDPRRDDYLEISILGREALLDPMDRLRRAYPNVLSLLRPDLERAGEGVAGRTGGARMSESDLFASFFAQVTGGPLEPAHRAAFESVLESLRRAEREVPA